MRRVKVPIAIIALAFLVSCNKLNQRSPAVVHAADSAVKWFKTEIPLEVFHDETKGLESAWAEGFWQSTSSDRDKQLVFPIAVKISCDRQWLASPV